MSQTGQPPGSEPALRIFAMPKDANANGDVFGGWGDVANGFGRRRSRC